MTRTSYQNQQKKNRRRTTTIDQRMLKPNLDYTGGKQQQQQIFFKHKFPLKFWLLMSVSFLILNGESFSFKLHSEEGEPINVRVKVTFPKENQRNIELSIKSNFEATTLSRVFAQRGPSVLGSKDYSFLKIMYEILSMYESFDFYDSPVFSLLTVDNIDTLKNIWKYRPSFKKIKEDRPKTQETVFIQILKKMFPSKEADGLFETEMSFAEVIQTLQPYDGIYDDDDYI